ncbi:hypothetical protein MNV_1740040 [Candidatus Methanoperedens nitroreducens]|uniref:FAD-dependent oxidoreductase 2 FAD binding domain-containing protein n=1 Tax=Candidatus Methanoperedens nitratireducens TaxID=1392998 RepID=A0A284VLZ5_9EURY|nr:hypothetical protein MNV_1740040 [Candidatus Methanoperedens nitroreducens]
MYSRGSMSIYQLLLLVLGSGSAAFGAAIKAVNMGAKVAMIET